MPERVSLPPHPSKSTTGRGGAQTSRVLLASESSLNLLSLLRGVYITYPARVKEPSRLATDMALADRLWTLQTELIEKQTRKKQ